jgi:hypothetical protein
MGVLVDYFAASSADVEQADLPAGPAGIGWPYVDCKGWLTGVADLVAELAERDVSEFGDDVLVSADPDEGPWLRRVRPEVVQALAGVSDERLATYAEDELLYDEEADRNVRLRDLARSALESGRDLYCWMSL